MTLGQKLRRGWLIVKWNPTFKQHAFYKRTKRGRYYLTSIYNTNIIAGKPIPKSCLDKKPTTPEV